MARTENNTINETSNKIESVACYIRVSTEEQAMHGISLAAQEEKLRTYAENNNMRIVEWYKDEGVSGRKEIRKRPELQRMIQDAEQGKFEKIIFIKLDRFFRSVAEYHECMKRIGSVTWATTEEKYDQTTSSGRFFINAKLAVAEMEADQTGERIMIVNDHKVSTGQPLTGSVPFCYMIIFDKESHKKKIVKNPETFEITTELLEHFQTHQSIRKTLKYINAKYNFNLSYKAVDNLLKNTLLYGEYRDNPKYISEPYIDKETFERIQNTRKRNTKANTQKREYIFCGLIKCPICGRTLKGGIGGNGKSSKIYKYYRCPKHYKDCSCEFTKTINETVLESLMLVNVKKYFEGKKIESAEIQDKNAFKMPKKSINEINERIDRLNYSWQTGKIRTVEQYEKQYADLAKELEEAKKDQQNVVVKDFSKIEAILQSGWKEIYNALDEEHKKAFWRSFVESIEIDWESKEKQIKNINFF
jgi:DNA invertase Pin-like site-specific DNA recombinase